MEGKEGRMRRTNRPLPKTRESSHPTQFRFEEVAKLLLATVVEEEVPVNLERSIPSRW